MSLVTQKYTPSVPKIAIIIPHRNDRDIFLPQMRKMLLRQSYWKYCTPIWMADPPKDDACDITLRYRTGYSITRHREYDVIFFMENDDYYAPTYIEEMYKAWEKADRPNLFGTRFTVYYHLKLHAYYTRRHDQNSHMMNTMIRPNLTFSWPLDHDPYTDAWLWRPGVIPGKTDLWSPDKILSIGIKHGIGKTGGRGHKEEAHRYINLDWSMHWLGDIVYTEDDLQFYVDISNKLVEETI